jgi:hypothetical protein
MNVAQLYSYQTSDMDHKFKTSNSPGIKLGSNREGATKLQKGERGYLQEAKYGEVRWIQG